MNQDEKDLQAINRKLMIFIGIMLLYILLRWLIFDVGIGGV